MPRVTPVLIALLIVFVADTAAQERLLDYAPSSIRSVGGPILPEGFYLQSVAAGSTFQEPIAVAPLPDGRLLVAEKRGVVYVIENGVRLPAPFLDLQGEVLNHADRGLLGLAIDPNFGSSGRVFLYYAVDHDNTGDYNRFDAFARVTSYAASDADPNVADETTRNVLVGQTFGTGVPACFLSHNGGHLAFGTDGTLLVSTGDAASYKVVDAGGLYPDCFGPGRFDTREDIGAFRSLRIESLAGKILRVDPLTGNGIASNPFYTDNPTDNASKVWAYGLRNPFRFAVRENGSPNPGDGQPGSLYIGDVGWVTWEEQQVALGGENFAWPCFEGPFEHVGYQAALPASNGCGVMPTRTDPFYYWNHDSASNSNPPGLVGFSTLGGAFYTGSTYPAVYRNAYFYADFAAGWIAFAHVDDADNFLDHTLFAEDLGFQVQIAYDPYRERFLLVDIAQGQINWLSYDDPATDETPVAIASATPNAGAAPLVVEFDGDDSFDPEGLPLSYVWDFGDGNLSADPNPTHLFHEPGLFAVTLAVSDPAGQTGTSSVNILVGKGSGGPEVFITEPTESFAAATGEEVRLSALAFDPDQDATTLAYHWSVSQVHNGHEHPNFLESQEPTTTLLVSDHGSPGELVYYHIYLTVTDEEGLSADDDRILRVLVNEEIDVTDAGSPVALKSQLPGGSLDGIERIRDGVFPPVGNDSSEDQFDTYTDAKGGGRTEDWIGYEFEEPLLFSRVTFQEGRHFDDGGWFEALHVEVRSDGVWVEPPFWTLFPEYRGNDGINFDTYELAFRALEGDAIRISGDPGGSALFISVGELRAFSLSASAIPATDSNGLAVERIFPNPSSTTAVVRLHTVEAGIHTIEVYDVLGRLVLRASGSSLGEETFDIAINLAGLASGPYLVRALGPTSVSTQMYQISHVR